jgi:hypothetical protein
VLAELEPQYGPRAARAANIVAVRRIQLGDSGRVWWVQSETDPTHEYMVVPVPDFGLWSCTCHDFHRRGGPCKHALAVRVLQACEAKEAAHVAASQPCAACGQPDYLTAGLCEPCCEAGALETEP